MAEKIKVTQYKKLDEAQKIYQDWRRALHLTEFETRVDFFRGFQREFVELEEELKNERKNRLNIAGEAADILLYAVGMLDQEGVSFSSLLANGNAVELFTELQKRIKTRIKERQWESSRQIVDKIRLDADRINEIIVHDESDIKPSLKEIVLDAASLISLLGFPIGPIISGKLARNEDKYKREFFDQSLLNNHFKSMGIVGQALPVLVDIRKNQLKTEWDNKGGKSLDAKYLKAALGPMAGLYLFGLAVFHRVK